MNNGNEYITPLTINVPPEVEYFIKECDYKGLNVYDIVSAIQNERLGVGIKGIDAVLVYESSNT